MGLVTSLIMGVGGLILLIVVTFIVVQTVQDANLLRSTAVATTAEDTSQLINSSNAGSNLSSFSSVNWGYTIVQVRNITDNVLVASGNYTFDATTGSIINTTARTWDSVNITFTYFSPTDFEKSTSNLGGNLTGGVNNVSTKIPTILLIGAVVLLFGVIVLLVKQSQAMGIGGSSRSGSL